MFKFVQITLFWSDIWSENIENFQDKLDRVMVLQLGICYYRDEVNKTAFKLPAVEQATKNGITKANKPCVFWANVSMNYLI